MNEPAQSLLAPAGPAAESIATLAWLLFGGGAAILAGVVALTLWALAARPPLKRWLTRDSSVLALGLVLPAAALAGLGVHGLTLTRDAMRPARPASLVIEVTGEQWWWRVRYPDAGVELANEIHVPVGAEVELRLASADVIHSFWVPRLAGKLDMVPGRVNRLRLSASEAGVYRGQCAEYCGGAHAFMAFHVVAESPAAFTAWLERQRAPAAEPAGALAERGRDAFLAAGCGACHAVRGTPAAGVVGPELTHLGSRLWLAAGTLPNHTGTLAGWIASSQHLKPGNFMPSFDGFTGVELRAVATWLGQLE